jgi:hypothetical protein
MAENNKRNALNGTGTQRAGNPTSPVAGEFEMTKTNTAGKPGDGDNLDLFSASGAHALAGQFPKAVQKTQDQNKHRAQ